MVLPDARTADTSEESLLHPTLEPDDRNLRRRLQSRRLDRWLNQCDNRLSRVL
jgi:hypothetical protein